MSTSSWHWSHECRCKAKIGLKAFPWGGLWDTQNHSKKPCHNSIRFLTAFRPQNCSKIIRKWSPNLLKNALKKHTKNHQKNGARISTKWMPKRSPGDPGEIQNHSRGTPGRPQGTPGVPRVSSGTPGGCLGFPRGAPDTKNKTKFT